MAQKQTLLVCLHCGNRGLQNLIFEKDKRENEVLHQEEDEQGFQYDVVMKHLTQWKLYQCPNCSNLSLHQEYYNNFMRSEEEEEHKVFYPGHDFSEHAMYLPWTVRNAC